MTRQARTPTRRIWTWPGFRRSFMADGSQLLKSEMVRLQTKLTYVRKKRISYKHCQSCVSGRPREYYSIQLQGDKVIPLPRLSVIFQPIKIITVLLALAE